MIKGKKRLVGIAINNTGKVSQEAISKLRHKAWWVSDQSQTLFFHDDVSGAQSCFVFEIYDAKNASIVKRICHHLRKFVAAALGYIWNGIFVTVIIE